MSTSLNIDVENGRGRGWGWMFTPSQNLYRAEVCFVTLLKDPLFVPSLKLCYFLNTFTSNIESNKTLICIWGMSSNFKGRVLPSPNEEDRSYTVSPSYEQFQTQPQTVSKHVSNEYYGLIMWQIFFAHVCIWCFYQTGLLLVYITLRTIHNYNEGLDRQLFYDAKWPQMWDKPMWLMKGADPDISNGGGGWKPPWILLD